MESPDDDWVRGQTNVIAVLFLCVGVYTGVGIFFQLFIFNLTGVRLTARLRYLYAFNVNTISITGGFLYRALMSYDDYY